MRLKTTFFNQRQFRIKFVETAFYDYKSFGSLTNPEVTKTESRIPVICPLHEFVKKPIY